MEKILIVDDNKEFLDNLWLYLTKNLNNCEITKVNNGYDALEMIKNFKPSILLLDLLMPNIDGNNIIEYLYNNNINDINIIIISGYSSYINNLKISKYSFIRKVYIKPFKYDNILIDINYILKENIELNIKNNIKQYLNEYKCCTESIYYKILIDAIYLCVLDNSLCYNLEKNLYKKISYIYGDYYTLNRIKWGISKSINYIIKYTDKSILKRIFFYEYPPTPKTFIYKISENVRKNLKGISLNTRKDLLKLCNI